MITKKLNLKKMQLFFSAFKTCAALQIVTTIEFGIVICTSTS